MNGASYVREDRYTLVVNGVRIRAGEDTEQRIREMDDEQLQRFLFIMNKERE